MAKKNKLLLALGVIFGLLYQSTLASAFSLTNVLSRGISSTNGFFMNSNNRAFIVLLGFFTLLLAVFYVAISKVKIFQKGNGKINNQGIAVMIVLAVGGFVGILFASPDGFYSMVEKFMDFSRTGGLIALGFLVFWLMYAALGVGGDE